ncbi:carbonic anhydrase [Desulfolithobacter sp.]
MEIQPSIGAEEALKRLMEGNRRFTTAKLTHPHQDPSYRLALNAGQAPFAAVLACADSRVPPEILFDQGLGDLFVVRVAGNIINDHILGSLEYACAHLGTSLVMVMAHSRCGAIDAVASGAKLEGHIADLGPAIKPAVERAKDKPGDLTDNAAREVARMTVEKLRNSEPVLKKLVVNGVVKIVPAFYELESGQVSLL